MRYLLVDQVVSFVPDERVSAIKCVTRESDVFEHHFQHFAIFPGALLLEAMAQAAGYLAIKSALLRGEHVVAALASVDRAHFRRPACPGDRLTIEAVVETSSADMLQATCAITCDESNVAKARLCLGLRAYEPGEHEDVVSSVSRLFRSLERAEGWL